MAEVNFPTAGGGSVTDLRYELLMHEVTGSGFLGDPSGSPALYADSTGRQVKLQPNRAAILRGYRWGTDSAGLTVPVAANTSGQPRLDLAVIRLDRSDWTTRFVIKQGAPAATPVAPSVTQDINVSNGVFEIPAGTIAVRSTSSAEASAGLPSIAPADVVPLHYHIGPPSVVCHSSRMPPAKLGQTVTQFDTGKVYHGTGSSNFLIGEEGPWTNVPGMAGFDQSNIWVQRRNGFVYFQCLIYRNAPGVTTAAGTDINIATLPEQFRPARGNVYLTGAHLTKYARFHLNGTTGVLMAMDYADPLLDNHYFIVHPATWLAR